MRLWHIELLPFLPKEQMVSQWRELNSVFKKQDKHILINYIYDYDKQVLYNYTQAVLDEYNRRGYKVVKWDNYNAYFDDKTYNRTQEVFAEHDTEYLLICLFNLKEKFIRRQKDFDAKLRNKIYKEFL